MFGNLVGYGDYGFVYEDETEINGPDGSVVKILNLNNLCNLQQYNMFIQLQNHQEQGIRTPGLPFVFQTFRGIMNPNILNILSYATTDAEARRQVRSTLPAGSEYGIITMERLPCIAQNQFCGRNLKDKGNQVEEQSIYEAMVTYLYDSGWWVRDLIDPRNIGYNIHGEPIWFDPMVARRQGFPGFSQQALEQCHEEVVAYPTSYRKAIESGKYFTERHGYGLFNSEAQTSKDLLHQAKNWPLIRDYHYSNSPNFVPSLSGNIPMMPNDIKILNSWEEWENMDREDQFGKWYYINWPCTVYRGSLKRGIDYETYLEDTAIKPGGHSANMGYENVIAAAPEMSEALMFGAFSVTDEGDIAGHEASELYAFDIQDYVVTFPRWSTQGRSGRELPVIFIAGGVYHDDAILLWEKEASVQTGETYQMAVPKHIQKTLRSEDTDKIICGNCNWSWKRSEGGDDPFVCHKCYFDNETYHSEAMNEAMFEKRYGWKVGSADNLNNRSEEFPISINFAYHNYPHFRLRDLFGAERWDDVEWTTTEPPRKQYEEWPEVKWNDQYRSTTGIFYSPAGRIGLQLRSELVLMPNTWSGISGFLDAGETPYDAVVREIHEESGLPVDTIKQWNHRVIWDDGSHRTYLFYVDTEFEPEVNEFKWEWDDWRWATLDSWKQVPNLHPGMAAALKLTQQSQ